MPTREAEEIAQLQAQLAATKQLTQKLQIKCDYNNYLSEYLAEEHGLDVEGIEADVRRRHRASGSGGQ